jgi:hypothetical protein
MLYWACHISKGAVFNYCKIQARERAENTNAKNQAGIYGQGWQIQQFLDSCSTEILVTK